MKEQLSGAASALMLVGCLLVSLWYFALSTQVVFLALDWLAPATKVVSETDFPCAHHNCGCKTAEQCRTHCCCAAGAEAPLECHEPSPSDAGDSVMVVNVSHVSAAYCSGPVPDGAHPGAKVFDCYFVSNPALGLLPCTSWPASALEPGRPLSVFQDPPEKIPI